MQQELYIAIFTGLATMLGWGFADFFAKKTIDRIGSIVSLVWAHVFGTIALAFVALYQFIFLQQPLHIPSEPSVWIGLLFFGALQSIVYLLAYQGFGKGQLSVLNPIFASYSGLAALISIVIFRETVSQNLLIALGIIFGGIVLLSVDMQALHVKRFNVVNGVKEVGLAALFASMWTIGWDLFVGGKDWVSYALYMYAFMTITAFVISKLLRVKLTISKKKHDLWKFFFLIGICETVAYLSLSFGFSATSFTSIVALLGGAFSLPTILLARMFLKEKVSRVQTIGSLIIVIGIIMLSL